MTPSFQSIADEIASLIAAPHEKTIPIRTFTVSELSQNAKGSLSEAHKAWLDATGWRAKPGRHTLLPSQDGVEAVLLCIDKEGSDVAQALQAGSLPVSLPEGAYHFENAPTSHQNLALAWLLGAYSFRTYLSEPRKLRRLAVSEGNDIRQALDVAQAVWFARQLINLPANDLGPLELAAALEDVGKAFGASTSVIAGEDLLKQNFPMIHMVGRASNRPPCLADLTWGDTAHPKVTIVGKGICFDTGGLSIKPAQAMALMKKDMGGAATAIALGAMIMAAKLPVRLRVLIPAADNSISGNAFRPGDIVRSRAGITVEIANTDAEGRLVLADALALADEEAPDLLVDFATLTGAARVALGPDLPPFYTDDEKLAEAVFQAGAGAADPIWRMPFWTPYESYLKSKVADINHVHDGPFAGSITAALFLKRFVKQAKRYLHLDIFGWVPKSLPGKPAGGEPQGARAIYDVIAKEFGTSRS